MRAWTLVIIVVGIASLALLVVAAFPSMSGPSSMQGGASAYGCGYSIPMSVEEGIQDPAMDRSFDYRAGDVFTLTFPAGRYYAMLEHAGGDLVFQMRRPPFELAEDASCSEKLFDARLHAYGDGHARFRVWVPEG